MINSELISLARMLEIKTRRACARFQEGDYQRSLQGSGFEFDQLSDYQSGCDVRFIDWKSTARLQKIVVRNFKDERQRNILLIIDVSASTNFGSQGILKADITRQIAAILLFASHFSHDAVGCMLFDEEVIEYMLPRNDKKYIIRMVNKILTFTTHHKKTNFDGILKRLMQFKHSSLCIIFISDFIAPLVSPLWRALANKHEIYAIAVNDTQEKYISDVPCALEDPETGIIIDLSSAEVNTLIEKWDKERELFFKKNKISSLTLESHNNFIYEVIRFFKMRVTP